MNETFLEIPAFIWNSIFTVITTLVCGLIVAIFTSTFLKKKEERTRIAGVILEKRINSEQELLTYLEKELFKEELNFENSSKYDIALIEMLKLLGFPVPYERNLQYAIVFKSMDAFGTFFHGFEDEFQKRRLWLDKKVRSHLLFMQMYFSVFNSIPLAVKKVPLPQGQELTDEEFEDISNKVLFLLGSVCDGEINELLSELDELIVRSVYKLDLKRPRSSALRSKMRNRDIKRISRRVMTDTIPGLFQDNVIGLILQLVYQTKKINFDAMDDADFDEFLRSADPVAYEELKQEVAAFKSSIKKVAEKHNVAIGSKEDLADHPGEYAVSLKDILTHDSPQIKTAEEFLADMNSEQ